MRREGRVRGKPSSKSRHSKKSGNTRKSVPKRLGSHKRITADDPTLTVDFVDDREEDDEVVDSSGSFVPSTTVNSVIEMALSKSSEKPCTSINAAKLVPDPANEEEFHGMASSSKIVGPDLDIPAIEEALHNHLGIFENAVEGDKFVETQFVRKWGAVLSEESWSDVEIVEFSDLEDEEEDDEEDDDWFVVHDHG